ncbi:MAG: prepilin-type cleavage/methylation domain-containing protein [Blastopirellula sp.]|nr:MAG: prepilin-type cleavage/methylation domain-containing protein [Blastopirellula sp.]
MIVKRTSAVRKGFSLLELLAVVIILGIIAAVVVPRVSSSSALAKEKVNAHNIATLNASVERYYVNEGSWPTALTDLGADYLPDGVPAVPTDGTLTYTLDGTTHRISAL